MNQWEKIYNDYPINQELIWLNNCGTTSPSATILRELNLFLEGFSRKGVLTEVRKFGETIRDIKKYLAELLQCHPEELALIHNTSEGMNLISHGLRLEKGDKILLLENEYPSNIYPWEHWLGKGVVLEYIPVGNTPEEFKKNLIAKLDKNVKVIALSAVHWCTGMPLPLDDIGQVCDENNINFILDGAQGVGHTEIDPQKMHISAMAFPAWKWLLGPIGLGVLYINNNFIEKLDFTFKGQNSVIDSDHYLPYKNKLKEGAARYEYSTPAFTEWAYFQESLKMIQEIGFAKVKQRIFELSAYLATGLRNLGYSLLCDKFPQTKTGIIAFSKDGIASEDILQKLKAKQIIGALRLGNIRLAPHIYNSTDQIDKVIDVLKSVNQV